MKINRLKRKAFKAVFRARGAFQRAGDKVLGVDRIHYLHISKTGGTALKEALENAEIKGKRIIHHPHEVSLQRVPRGEAVVFFVRDPVSRYTSSFYSRRRQGRPRFIRDWSPEEAEAYGIFATPNELALGLTSDDAGRRAAAVRAMRNIVHVRSSYWDWFISEQYLRSRRSDLLFVGAQESFAGDVAELSRLLGAGLELPNDDCLANRNPTDVDKSLSEQALRNVVDWYAKDYDFLAIIREWFPNLPDYRPPVPADPARVADRARSQEEAPAR